MAVAEIQETKFNQLEVAYSIAKDSGFRMPGKPVSVVGLFTVSPTCDLWFRAEDWPARGEREMRMRKMNAKAAETALSYYKVSRKPSIFEVVVEMEPPEPQEQVLDACASWLAKFVPKTLGSLAIFGCVDIGGPEFFVKLESNVLMTEHIRILAKLLPSAYPELGQRFDALHPVMFGSKKVCDGIGSSLGKEARVIPSDTISDFAVVRLCVGSESTDASRRVLPWILPCAGESAATLPNGE